MKEVKIGVVGLGSMGGHHAKVLREGRITRGRLTAVCDQDASKRERFSPDIPAYESAGELLRSGNADAVVIATPHFDHTPSGILALRAGVHVLVEKPISAHKADAQKLIAAHRRKGQLFAAMFNQRTDPLYRRIRDFIMAGDLGRLQRVSWIITDWFRSDAYYASSPWRATWRGEGGGALLNQCPHQLDLLQWIVGVPKSVRAWCRLGQYHDIEVEDDVTAYLELRDGATGIFITSTGEAPGANRLEIVGTKATVIAEGRRLKVTRNSVASDEWSRTTKERFQAPPAQVTEETFDSSGPQHSGILQNFVDAILDGVPLIAPAREGLHSVEMANAMILSSLGNKSVAIPMNAKLYAAKLKALISSAARRRTK